MIKKLFDNPIVYGILGLICIGAFIWFIYLVLPVIVYIILALLIYIIFIPLIKILDRVNLFGKKIPKTLQAFICLSLIGTIIFFLFINILPIFLIQWSKINTLLSGEELPGFIAIAYENIQVFLQDFGIEYNLKKEAFAYLNIYSVDIIKKSLQNVISFSSTLGMSVFATIFISFFLLKDSNMLQRISIQIFSEENQVKVLNAGDKISQLLRRYLIGIIIQISILIGLYWMLLSLYSIPNAFLISFLAGICNLIPYLGPILGGLLIFMLGFTSLVDVHIQNDAIIYFQTIIHILIYFATIQVLDAFISQPIIYSNSVKAHPLEIFIVILIVANIGGVVGMVFAIPFYTVIRIIAKEFITNFKWINSLTKNI